MEIHRDLGQPNPALRWNSAATQPTDTYTRSYGLRLVVLASTRLLGQHPDLDAALAQGNHAVDVLAGINSARARRYADDLLHRLTPWQHEPGVADLETRIRSQLTVA